MLELHYDMSTSSFWCLSVSADSLHNPQQCGTACRDITDCHLQLVDTLQRGRQDVLRLSTARGALYQDLHKGKSMCVHVCASSGGLYTVLMEGKRVEMICNPIFLLQTPLEPKKISRLVSCPSLRIKLIQ